MIAVWSQEPGAAVAELPRSATASESPSGAIALFGGHGDWVHSVHAAFAAGAIAAVVREPSTVPASAVIDLHTEAGDRPVVLDRSRLAAATALPAVASFQVLVAECSGTKAELPALIRDSIGWLRVLGGSSSVEISSRTRAGVLVSLTAAGGVPASLLGDVLTGASSGGLIRVLGLGPTRREVVVDHAAGFARIIDADEQGALQHPALLESTIRGALRRAIAAVSGESSGDDLEAFLHDLSSAETVLAAGGPDKQV